jgi:antitoxin CcdA
MHLADETASLKRRPVNLTIREDILEEAKSLRLNTSKAAESGIAAAIRQAHSQEWLEANQQVILAHNLRVDATGPLLTPAWSIR